MRHRPNKGAGPRFEEGVFETEIALRLKLLGISKLR